MTRKALLAGAALFLANPLAAQETTTPDYPVTRSEELVETMFGEKVADPYRWLENDVRSDAEVADWVARENAVTQAYLGALPGTKWFKQHIAGLLDYERFGLPVKAGTRYFYTRNSGLQNQSELYVQDGLDGQRRVLIDPNSWAKDGATALAGWEPSDKGNYLLYSIQDGGTDWRILRVIDVATGKQTDDEVRWAKFTGLEWVGEEGFLYSRFPEPEEGKDFQALNYNQAVYFHRLGTPQSEDQLVYATPDRPKVGHFASVSKDGQWAIITSSTGTDARYEVHLIDLSRRAQDGWKSRPLVTGFDNAWNFVAALDGKLYFVTNKDAPKYRLVTVDPMAKDIAWTTLIPESEMPIEAASIVGDRLIVSYLKDASTEAMVFGLDGKPTSAIAFNGIGTASGFGGRPGDPETFYNFESFNRPDTIYRLDLATGETSTFAKPELTFDPDDFVVEQVFYPSRDGTRVPMFIVRKKELADSGKPAPTLLYGYGGFDVSLTPSFSATRMAWLEAGGVFALANIRGGGEYGKEWHDAGRLANKQNVFDDFIAAGEYLKANGYTTPKGLAVQGGSNGGLLIGAVINQRPDLFDAANAAVGVMDMLRFTHWTAGRYWVDDYGDPAKEADFRILRTYSPYHNIRPGVAYPPVLVTTADTDDRVVPGHSFKYTAALQAADPGGKPHLIRIETRAGHGSGKPTDKVIDEYGDVLGFLAHWTGLEVPQE
ncbi:MAG: S9 family peptidase [Sphingomonadales bacterium]|nr:S9 family peptidase [Sphingomonadales bacterium]MBD3773842.1 S9 family peptidase [Paracoccaceae bacterium]